MILTAGTRPIPAHFTAQQRAFVQFVAQETGHGMLRATAGSGKTTTGTEAAWYLPRPRRGERIGYFVYNTHSAQDLKLRLPQYVWGRTVHSYGKSVLEWSRGEKLRPEDKRSDRLAQLYVQERGPGPARAGKRQERHSVARVWDQAREALLDHESHEDDLAALAAGAEWEGSLDDLRRALRGMEGLSLSDWRAGSAPDFTDMLWLPVKLGLGVNSVSVAIVDEAQDLTPLRQAFVLHLLGLGAHRSGQQGRLLLIGDPEQSIYAWAGADPQAMPRLARRLGMRELPLSVSFRCPASHVAIAQTVSGFIEAPPGARAGTVEHHPAKTLTYQKGDVILARMNAALVREALRLMGQSVSVNIRGRDLAERLNKAAREAFPNSFTEPEIRELVNVLYTRRAEPLKKRAGEGDLSAKRALVDLKDLMQCLRLLARRAAEQGGGRATSTDLGRVVEGLYREDGDVLLSTVHRAKGLEWPRVTVLFPELMPHLEGDPAEERCVQFVAFTRGMETLRFGYGQGAWQSGWRVTAKGETPPVLPPQVLEAPELETFEEPGVAGEAEGPAFAGRTVDVTPFGEALPSWADMLQLPELPTVEQAQSEAGGTVPIPVSPAPPLSDTPLTAPLRSGASSSIAASPLFPAPDSRTLEGSTDQLDTKQSEGTPLAFATQAPQRAETLNSTPGHAGAPGSRRVREAQLSTSVEDVRHYPLFGGDDPLSVSDLRLRLHGLTEEPRLALKEWAEASLVLLRSVNTRFVLIDGEALADVERAALRARLAVPRRGPLGKREVEVVVFGESVARVVAGQRGRSAAKVVSVTVQGEARRFDPRTGELLGEAFTPFCVHLRSPENAET